MSITVAISGIGEVLPGRTGAIESLETLIFGGATAALEAAALTRADLDGVVLAASDQIDGRAISSMLTAGPAGAYLTEEINVASSPGHALVLACMQVQSGTHRRLLVSSWGKASEALSGSAEAAERLSAEPFFERDGGLSSIAASAMQAQRHRASSSQAEGAAWRVASRNHGEDETGRRVTEEDVAASPVLAYPLRRLEYPKAIDGTFSLVVEAPERELDNAVLIDGFGWCSDSGRIAERDLAGLPHLARAAHDAYSRAGVGPGDIDVWELHDYTPDAELLAYEAVSLCERGQGPELVLSGETERGGSRPVNPAGGSVAGEAPFGGSLRKILAAVRQLQHDAGAAQVPAAARAVAHITSGFAGQFQSVFVLTRQER